MTRYQVLVPKDCSPEIIAQIVDILRNKMVGGLEFVWEPERILADFFSLQTFGFWGIIEDGKIKSMVVIARYENGDLWLVNQWGEGETGKKWKHDIAELLDKVARAVGAKSVGFHVVTSKEAAERFFEGTGFKVAEVGCFMKKEVL